jgi:hypothetical protein
LSIVISTGRSTELLSRNVTVKELVEMSFDDLEAYNKIHDLNYPDENSSSLNNAFLDFYSYAVNEVVPVDDVETLKDKLH